MNMEVDLMLIIMHNYMHVEIIVFIMVIPYNGYFLRLSNFCGILRVYRNRKN